MVKTQTITDIQFCLLHLTTNYPGQHKEIKEEIEGLWLPKQENKKLKSFFEKASDDFILIKVFNYRGFLKTDGFSLLSVGSEDILQNIYYRFFLLLLFFLNFLVTISRISYLLLLFSFYNFYIFPNFHFFLDKNFPLVYDISNMKRR